MHRCLHQRTLLVESEAPLLAQSAKLHLPGNTPIDPQGHARRCEQQRDSGHVKGLASPGSLNRAKVARVKTLVRLIYSIQAIAFLNSPVMSNCFLSCWSWPNVMGAMSCPLKTSYFTSLILLQYSTLMCASYLADR